MLSRQKICLFYLNRFVTIQVCYLHKTPSRYSLSKIMKLIKSTLLEKDQKQLEMRHKCKKLAVQHVSHLNEQSNTCSKVLDTFRFPINSYEAVPSCTHFGIISSLNIHQTVKVFCFIIQSLLLMLLNLEFSETHKYS